MSDTGAALPIAKAPSSIRRVIVASLMGTSLEWYNFFIYGTAAALVFNKLFFPTFDPLDRYPARLHHLCRRLRGSANAAASLFSGTTGTSSAARTCSS